MNTPLLSAVIVTYNSRDDIGSCLQALLSQDYPRLELIVVDNASSDGTADLVATSFPGVHLLRSATNLGFAGGNNAGFAAAAGAILLCVNPDVRLHAGAANAFAEAFAADPRLGIAGAKLLYPDGHTIQHAGGVVEYPLATTHHRGFGETDVGHYDTEWDAPFVTGAALALRREVMAATGGFDAGFFPVYYEDVDLCYRARSAGWRVAYIPSATGLHRTSASLDPQGETYYRYYHANRVRFVMRHWSIQKALCDFLPAEGERLRGEMPAADRRSSRRVYGALGAPGATVMRRQVGDTMEDNMATPADNAGTQALDELDALGAGLSERWRVTERPFTSQAPLVGPLIAAFRTAWNNVATRWYVQPMLQQQVDFNQATARAVAALARAADAQQAVSQAAAAITAGKLEELDQRVAALEKSEDGCSP